MRITIVLFLFNFVIQIKAISQLPACKDSFPSSLLLNNSFEQYSGCVIDYGGSLEGGYVDAPAAYGGIQINNWHSFYGGREVHYFNYNCRTNRLGSVFDTTDFVKDKICSYYFPRVPLPLPDSNGFISTNEDDQVEFRNENKIAKDYITYCLSQSLYAGQAYLLSFYFGFGTKDSAKCPLGTDIRSQSPYSVAIFGRQDCPAYPVKDAISIDGCLANFPGWVKLGNIRLKGKNEWITGAIQFTPQTSISCIGIGPDCDNNSFNSDFYYTASMHFMDKLILAPLADFSFRTITALSGNVCTGHFVLKAPTYANATYQWYKDGALIPGATSEIYTVPDKAEAAGNYVVNIGQPYNTCLNSLPFAVTFSDLNKFSLGNDTLLCAPASITLNASQQSASKYLWQDGSNNQTLNVDRSGLYWVQLEDENGCTKKDSINITIQGCDECRLFVSSAFTPNDDGLNDVFKVKPQCPNIGLLDFSLRIYNRWGQLVFISNDINKGWNGMFKGTKLNTGAYIYLIDYSFKKNRPLQQKGTIVLLR